MATNTKGAGVVHLELVERCRPIPKSEEADVLAREWVRQQILDHGNFIDQYTDFLTLQAQFQLIFAVRQEDVACAHAL
jgi:hypothetical protein